MYSEYYSNKKLCKRVITKCEPICLYEILKFKEIQTFDLYTIYIDDYCSYTTDTYTYLSVNNYINMNVVDEVDGAGILFDLDNFNINDFNPESIIVELYKKAINHRNYKLSKILELC